MNLGNVLVTFHITVEQETAERMDSLFWFFRLTVYIMVIMLIIWLSYYHGIMKQLSRVQSTLKSRYEGDWAKNPQGPHLVMHSLLGQLRSMCSST